MLEGHEETVYAFACRGEGDARRAVSGGGSYSQPGELLVWDLVKGGAPLFKLEGHTTAVWSVACLGDGDECDHRHQSGNLNYTIHRARPHIGFH